MIMSIPLLSIKTHFLELGYSEADIQAIRYTGEATNGKDLTERSLCLLLFQTFLH